MTIALHKSLRSKVVLITAMVLVFGQLYEYINRLMYIYYGPLDLLFAAGQLLGMGLLLSQSQLLRQGVYRYWLLLCATLILVGVLMKLLHYPYFKVFYSLSFTGLGAVYLVYFYNKIAPVALDWVKLTWVVLVVVAYLFSEFKWQGYRVMMELTSSLFTLLFLVYAWQSLRPAPPSRLA